MDHDEYPPMEPTAWSSEEDPEPVEVDQRALIDKVRSTLLNGGGELNVSSDPRQIFYGFSWCVTTSTFYSCCPITRVYISAA